jgi:hypothetical protein
MMDERALMERVVRLEDRLGQVEADVATVPAQIARAASEIPTQADNKLRNGNYAWNTNDYKYAVDDAAADTEFECAWWFTTPPYASGTELLEDSADNNTDANAATTSALMFYHPTDAARRHSLYNTAPNINDPDFDMVNGWMRVGSDNAFCQPLSQNWAHAGKKLFVSFIAILRPHVLDAAINIGTDLLNSASMGAVANDVGRKVKVYTTAGEVTLSFEAKIKTRNSATQVQLENLDGTAFAAPATLATVLAIFSGSFPATGVELGFWVYDNTAGQRKRLEGTADVLNLRATVKGTPAATVSAKYRIVATTDWGDEIVSNEVTVNRPTDPSYVTGSAYVLLQWDRLPGVLSYDIYMDTGGVLQLIYQSDTDSGAYADQGRREKTVGAWPAGSTLPVAYAAFNEGRFSPANWYDDKSAWGEFVLGLNIPAGYDMGLTTDRQWLVGGLSAALTGAGMARSLIIDQMMLTTDPGKYADSGLDEQAVRPQSITMAGSYQGGAGTGGGGAGTNPGDAGGERCPVESAQIALPDGTTKRAGDLRVGNVILSGRLRPVSVTHVLLTEPVQVWRLVTRRGRISRGSASHPVIRHTRDRRGLALCQVEAGEMVLIAEEGRLVADRAQSCTPEDEPERVVEIGLAAGEHTYVADGIVFHNIKFEQNAV